MFTLGLVRIPRAFCKVIISFAISQLREASPNLYRITEAIPQFWTSQTRNFTTESWLQWPKMTLQIASFIGISYGERISLLYSTQYMVCDSSCGTLLPGSSAVIGQDEREANSPSYFNRLEIDQVGIYLDTLLGDPALGVGQSYSINKYTASCLIIL